MDEQSSLMEKFELFMNQNTKGVEVGVYSVAFVGLAVALRRIRPFSRFSRPNDIPNRFLTFRTQLTGTVERIEPNGALLMIKHKPLIPILPAKPALPVKVSGITINGHGISWLQSIIAGHEVTFIPVVKDKNCVHCEVMLQQGALEKKLRVLNVGPALVQIDFGSVCPVDKTLTNNPFYAYYYEQLKSAENRAAKRRLGNWYYVKTTKELTQKLLNMFVNLLKLNNKRVPQLASV